MTSAAAAALELTRPADRVLSAFFREHRELGARDRAEIAETVFAILRRKRLLEYLLEEVPPVSRGRAARARALVLAALAKVRGVSVREVSMAASDEESAWLAEVRAAPKRRVPFEVDCDLPDWVIERLLPRLGRDELLELAHALAQTAPLDLRVNLLKASRPEVIKALATDGIAAEATPYSPEGIRLAGKPALQRHRLFLGGEIEVQDEGSQLVCRLMAPRRGEMVVDFCAGAGGKSLALGALMRSTGRVYAFDVSERRLANLGPRLARSGLSNVHPQRIAGERDPRVGRLAGKIDRVLVDAPCSGLGTVRRNPDLKWRQQPEDVARMTAEQASILDSAARLVRPGGRLVYATCSLLEEENESTVSAFLARSAGFSLVPAAAVLERQNITVPQTQDDGYLRLLPHRHGTDGFFAAVLERAK